jgi:PAS domain S-box-containing protein
VAIAALARAGLGDGLSGVPYITFYPAIAAAALLGGARAGSLAVLISAAVANYFFIPPVGAWQLATPHLESVVLFMLVSAMLVALISLLNKAVDRLWATAETAKFILETEPAGVLAVDDKGVINMVNAAVEHQLGYARDELIGRPVEVLIPVVLRAGHESLRGSFLAQPEPRRMGAGRDLDAQRKDGSLVPVEVGLSPYHREGRTGALATIIDVSERKRLEFRSEMLTREVQHRASNLLMMVEMVARRLLSGSQRTAFLSVLAALSRTHHLLAVAGETSLRDIIAGEVEAFAGQVTFEVCDVMLKPEVAQDFTLIVHELTTNALKHGALSTDEGRVSIRGEVRDGVFRFCWEESGGPPVEETARAGFGSTILGKVARGFASDVRREARPEGLRYEVDAALHSLGAVRERVRAVQEA